MRLTLMFLSVALLLLSSWIGLTAGRIEPECRNIIYMHVPSSIAALVCFCVLLAASVGYLATSRVSWDRAAAAAAEVGLIYATLLNVTGSIFSRAEWNVWWTPSPRLVTAAVLWFLYIVYAILRASLGGGRGRGARVCAVFAIIAFLDVPMVIISARFMPDIHRAGFSFDSAWQTAAFLPALASMLLLAAVLIWLKADLLAARDMLEKEI